MLPKLLSGMIAVAFVLSLPQSVDAGYRRVVSQRTINSYQRDVRQFQRTSGRSFNQFSRGFSRGYRSAAPIRYAPRSSGIYFGSPRSGVYLRF